MTMLEGATWPPITGGLAAQVGALLALLERTQWFAPDEIAAGQAHQLAALVAHHAAHAPAFARRLAAAGLTATDVATPNGLAHLPVIGRRDVQDTPDLRLDVVPAGHAPTNDFSTSGSTGEPLVVRRTAVNRIDWLAMTMRDHRWQRRNLSGRFCTMRAHIHEQTRPDWGPPATLFGPTGPMLMLPIEYPIERQVEVIRAFAPTSLMGYPNNLAAIVAHVRRARIDLTIPDLRTLGETIPEGLREEAALVLGGRLVDCYSSHELGYLALQCPDGGGYHMMAETHLVEILDDSGRPAAPGAEGEVVVTDLRNFAMPLIRYAPGDRAVAGGPCSCGRGLPTIERIIGRTRNLLVHPDGRRNWPTFGQKDFPAIADVREYQFIQHAPNRIEMRLVTASPFTPDRAAALRARIIAALDGTFTLDFTLYDDALPKGRTGKREEFLCLVPPDWTPA